MSTPRGLPSPSASPSHGSAENGPVPPSPSTLAYRPSRAVSSCTQNFRAPSSPPLSDSAQNVSAETECLSDRAAPATTSLPWKSPHAARCILPAADTPASSPFLSPPRRSRGDALETHHAPLPPSPVAPAGAHNRQSCFGPAIPPAQTHPPCSHPRRLRGVPQVHFVNLSFRFHPIGFFSWVPHAWFLRARLLLRARRIA